MKTSFLLSFLITVTVLAVVSCAPVGSSDRTVEEEIFAAESITGLFSSDNSSQVIFTSCTDNDGDKSFYKGRVTARYTYQSRLGVFSYTDTCRTERKLVEFICDGAKPERKVVVCQKGCSWGACLK